MMVKAKKLSQKMGRTTQVGRLRSDASSFAERIINYCFGADEEAGLLFTFGHY